MAKLKVSQDNKESRLFFVEYWAQYMKEHTDKEWGEQQNMLINSQMQSAKHYPFSTKKYLEMKGEISSR
ncbi:MAG TPA: hypothetical protein VJA18_05925 [Candidatus Nanoarchaeia archaeon]|nr:hypothetical protein [Candidatus Nanoarchaeia archaeon]